MFVCRYGLRTTDSKRISYWNAKSYITRHVAFYVHSAGGKWITGIRDAIGPSRRAVVYERVIWTHENRWISTTTPSWNGEFRCSGQWHRNSPFHDGIVVDSHRFSWVHITRSYTTAGRRRDGPMASRRPIPLSSCHLLRPVYIAPLRDSFFTIMKSMTKNIMCNTYSPELDLMKVINAF